MTAHTGSARTQYGSTPASWQDRIIIFDPDTLTSLSAVGVYAVVWTFIFLETGLLLGLLLPGSTLLIAAGFLAAVPSTRVDVWVLAVGAVAAAFLGDQSGYRIGRRTGVALLQRRGGARFQRAYEVARHHVLTWQTLTMLTAPFTPWGRTFVPFIAGTLHLPLRRFSVLTFISVVLWVGVWTTIGWAGHQVPALRANAGWVLVAAATFMIGSGVLAWVWERRERARGRSTGGGEPADGGA